MARRAPRARAPGTGSSFVIELPLIDLHPDGQVAAAAAKPSPRRVLVIEDNKDSAESLKMYLALLGHQVAVANSGSEGVRLAAADPPDVVVCDIGLPGMSGHAVCAELKKLPALSQTTVVALTGHSAEPGAEGGAKGGFDFYLLKPVDPPRLAEVIRQARQVPRPS